MTRRLTALVIWQMADVVETNADLKRAKRGAASLRAQFEKCFGEGEKCRVTHPVGVVESLSTRFRGSATPMLLAKGLPVLTVSCGITLEDA
jgi:hypothetical protein